MIEQNYCSFCGSKLIYKKLKDGTREKYCSSCDHVFFHALYPCIIVLISNANKILLARGVEWKQPYWALISGYIKPGETAKKAAIREVQEEVGLNIRNLELIDTYAQKDKNLLMIAFRSKVEDSFIKKSQELETAKWFDLSCPLPLRPESTAFSIVKRTFPEIKLVKNYKQFEVS